MKVNFLKLYERLIRDLMDILAGDSSETEKMESCFRCCIGHWNRLKSKIKQEGFESDQQEIHFFKNIKPRFTGEIEFYTQRYHAMLFLPGEDKKSQQDFWRGELSRMDKFFGTHRKFFDYYNSGKTGEDSRYFLRQNSDGSNLAHMNVYDIDQQTATSHDWLLTNMIAYEKYRKYVLQELEECSK